MKYAVVWIGGRQYKVSEGDEILVDKLSNSKIDPKVLLVSDEEEISLGKPSLPGTRVKVKLLKEEEKGKKIKVFKYKAKSRYRKHMGFRPVYSRLLIEKIS